MKNGKLFKELCGSWKKNLSLQFCLCSYKIWIVKTWAFFLPFYSCAYPPVNQRAAINRSAAHGSLALIPGVHSLHLGSQHYSRRGLGGSLTSDIVGVARKIWKHSKFWPIHSLGESTIKCLFYTIFLNNWWYYFSSKTFLFSYFISSNNDLTILACIHFSINI